MGSNVPTRQRLAGTFQVLDQEFTEALTEVLAENSVGYARRGRLARARAAVKKHPNYSEHNIFWRWKLRSQNGKQFRTSAVRPRLHDAAHRVT